MFHLCPRWVVTNRVSLKTVSSSAAPVAAAAAQMAIRAFVTPFFHVCGNLWGRQHASGIRFKGFTPRASVFMWGKVSKCRASHAEVITSNDLSRDPLSGCERKQGRGGRNNIRPLRRKQSESDHFIAINIYCGLRIGPGKEKPDFEYLIRNAESFSIAALKSNPQRPQESRVFRPTR